MDLKTMQRERLQQYLDAERAILSGQEYTIGDRRLRRADVQYVQQQIENLLVELNTTEFRRGMTKRAVFIE